MKQGKERRSHSLASRANATFGRLLRSERGDRGDQGVMMVMVMEVVMEKESID